MSSAERPDAASGGPSWSRGQTDAVPGSLGPLHVLVCVFVAMVFLLDLSIPLGVAAGVPYIAPVLVSLSMPGRRSTLTIAVVASLLTLLGLAWSPPGGEMWKVLSNRGLALFAIWATTVLVLQRKQGEEALNESLSRTRAILGAAVDGMVMMDAFGTIESVNPVALSLFGYSEDELIGQNVRILMSSPDREDHDGHLARYRETGEKRTIGLGREVLAQRKDGTTFSVDLAVSEVVIGDRRHFVGTVRDLSERKRMEAELVQAQKMEAVGQLAGGVAHDFNNLLASIQGSCELVLAGAGEDLDLRRSAERIHMAVDRGTALTKRLLAFSRKQAIRPETVDLNSLVVDVNTLVEHLIDDAVETRLDLADSPVHVHIDSSHFDQIALNLVVNAIDAMPRGGRLTIATSKTDVPEGEAESIGVPPGPYVTLTVSDTGEGIVPEVLAQIFEPFFTTKESGRGTGLGLSTVQRIIVENGGGIRVETEPGSGTTFSVYLPAVDAVPAARSQGESAQPTEPGSETVLLVEDDPLLRELVGEVLGMSGYTVLSAGSTEEALPLARENLDRLDLIVSDVVMPGMSGRELVEEIRRSRPDMKALFMSGYAEAALAQRGMLDAEESLIRKPFSNKILVQKVRAALDSTR